MKKQPRLRLGDVVFVKEVSESPDKKCEKIRFSGGWGFAMMLGVVEPFAKPPEEKHLTALLGQAGYISFDDVSRFLGKDQAAVCVTKVSEIQQALFAAAEAEKEKRNKSKLVTASGAPLSGEDVPVGKIHHMDGDSHKYEREH